MPPRPRDVPTRTLARRLVAREALGFGALLVLLGVDDLTEVGRSLPFRWGIVEALAAVGVALLTLASTRRLVKRLVFLEGLVSICMYCKRVRDGEAWVPVEGFVRRRSNVEFSHGMCPECFRDHESGFGA